MILDRLKAFAMTLVVVLCLLGAVLYVSSAYAQTGNGTGQAGSGNPGNGEPGTEPPTEPEAVPPPEPVKDGGDPKIKVERPIARFGDDFFSTSRAAIQTLKERMAAGGAESNAFTSATGPIVLGNVTATAPDTYQLGPGDRLTVRVSSPFSAPTETQVTVDSVGAIIVPNTGTRIILRGQTLKQAEEVLRAEISQYLRQPTVLLLLDELRTFQVTVLGESFAPGAYTVPATFSLFNLILATGGPTERGTMRSIQLRRNNSVARTFDLYRFLISGDAGQDVQLQPGDVVFYPVAIGEASVEGEVNRPGVFELLGNESLSDLLRYAGGIRPSGVSQNVAVDSVVPGSERRLLNVDVNNATPDANPVIRGGDKVHVFSIRPVIRNQVTIQGPVEQPRSYAIQPGMRVRDLVQLALGLRPEADLSVAEVLRTNPDRTQTLIRIDLGAAMGGSPSANIELKPDDLLRVYDVNDTAWRGERRVLLQGAVREPGTFERANDMRVVDLIRQGRGLQPNAFTEEAHLQRFNLDGTPGPLIKINLVRAALGDPSQDILLQDRDQLRVYTIQEWQAVPEQSVEISGAVQRAGTYTLAENMRLKDLLELAGGPTLDASRRSAFLQRTNTDGTLGPLLVVDIDQVMAGAESTNIALQARDRFTVYTLEQAQFLAERTVTIMGGVQRPGTYPRSENMTLAQLISLAGGTIPNSESFALVTPVNVPEGTESSKIPLGQASTTLVRDQDRITIPLDSSVLEEPIQVVIQGAVANPGTYYFNRKDARFLDLLELAGGLRGEAWLRGGQVARRPDLLRTDAQRSQEPRLMEVLMTIQDNEYQRAVARAELDRLIVLRSSNAQESSQFVVPGLGPEAPAAPNGDEPKLELTRTDLVTPARSANAIDNLIGGNLTVRLEEAVRNPKSMHNFTLLPGDIITIPDTPSTVLVDGPGVALPQGIIFEPGRSLRDYLSKAGGLTPDADSSYIIIIRPGGSLLRPRMSTRIELGDVILVPTRVMTTRLISQRDEFERVVRSVANTALIYGLFRNLLR
ncbi:MAG: SLBB domain-containing protein [Fimbriimonadaceae bacterium]